MSMPMMCFGSVWKLEGKHCPLDQIIQKDGSSVGSFVLGPARTTHATALPPNKIQNSKNREEQTSERL